MFGLIEKASMVGFTLLSRSYYYLRRRSPGPPFPPDHRQAGERGANRLLKNQTVPNELRTKRHTPHGVAVTNATTRNFTKPPALAQDQESIRVVTKARGRGVPEARGTRTEQVTADPKTATFNHNNCCANYTHYAPEHSLGTALFVL